MSEISNAPEIQEAATPRAAADGEQSIVAKKAAAKKAAEDQAELSHREEMRKLEIESKRLEVLEKQANIEDIGERLAERQLKREAIRQKAYTNGATLKDTANRQIMIEKRCNHRKGGDGAAGIQLGQGVSPHYAVIKHGMMNGDLWIRCQRCGKTWKPPIKADYLEGGQFAVEGIDGYVKALTEYETAKNFPTNNSPSSSQQFKWSDNGAYAREVLRHTNLR